MLTKDKHEWLSKCLSTYHSIEQVAQGINHVTESSPCTPEEIAAVYAIDALEEDYSMEAIEYHLDQLIEAHAIFGYAEATRLCNQVINKH